MDWAQGIEVEHGQLVARVADAEGKQELLALKELSTRGLPTTYPCRMRNLRVDLSRLKLALSDEYLNAFGLQKAGGSQDNHLVYELAFGKRRLLIPGLALIRGLLRPTSVLLDEVFRPQMLESICLPTAERGKVRITATWARRVGPKLADPSPLLSWLWRSQAAKRLADSVHRYAMQGLVGFEPQQVHVDLTSFGIERGDTRFITRCTATRAYVPMGFPSAPQSEEEIVELSSAQMYKQRTDRKPLQLGFGSTQTTDSEWEVIYPILRPDTRGREPRVETRVVWSLLLRELTGDNPPTQATVSPAEWRALRFYRGQWMRQHAVSQALTALQEMRAGQLA